MESSRKIRQALLTHKCELPPEEDVIVKFINSGYFVLLRRFVKRAFICSWAHPKSRAILKSQTAIKVEQMRHLQYYHNSIHPFSEFRLFWEHLVFILLAVYLMILPMQVSSEALKKNLRHVWLFVDIIMFFDLVFNFLTGFFHSVTRYVILKKSCIAVHYVFRGTFILDALGCTNVYGIMLITGDKTYHFRLRLLLFLKFFRIATFYSYLERIREAHSISVFKLKVFKIIILPFIFLNWWGALFFVVGRGFNEIWLPKHHWSDINGYLIGYYRAVRTFFKMNSGTFSQSEEAILLECICTFSGLLYYIYILSQILQIVNKYNSSSNKYYKMSQEMQEFMQYKHLPINLRNRMQDFFLFKYQKHYFKESQILNTLSVTLRESILLHQCRGLLDSAIIFQDLPLGIKEKIASVMLCEIYLPNDVIIQSDTIGEAMYFISSGTVAVYTASGKEVCHLEDGNHFGEIALVYSDEKRVASVIAVEPSEIYSLTQQDFNEAMDMYPAYYNRIKRLLDFKLTKILTQMQNCHSNSNNLQHFMHKHNIANVI